MQPPEINLTTEKVADELATKYSLDQSRLRTALERYTLPVHVFNMDESGILSEAITPGLTVDFDEVCQRMAPAEALDLLEAREPQELFAKRLFVDILSSGDLALYNLEELEDVMRIFIQFLEVNRKQLINNGLPKERFDRSPWFDTLLSDLYPEIHLQPEVTSEAETEVLPRGHTYRSSINLEIPLDSSAGVPQANADVTVVCLPGTAVPCRQLPHAEVFDSEQSASWSLERVYSNRQRILDLKIRVLWESIAAVREGDATGLWDNALSVLTREFAAHEIDFYLWADQQYGYLSPGQRVGGISQILLFTGHVEKELTIRALARVRRLLDGLVVRDEANRPHISAPDYLDVVRKPEQAMVDEAFSSFRDSESREDAFWEDYQQRVNRAVADEFYVDTSLCEKIKRRYAEKYKVVMPEISKKVIRFIEATGEVPELEIQPVAAGLATPNLFLLQGDYWRIMYMGEEIHLRDSKGLRILRLLLENPGVEKDVLDLTYSADSESATTGKASLPSMTKDEAEDTRLDAVSYVSTDKVIDVAEYVKLRKKAEERLEKAILRDDPEAAEEARQAMDWIDSELESHRNLFGESRQFASSLERARTSVSHSVSNALRSIRKHHRVLADYLDTHIHTGYRCCYHGSVRWRT